jgi:hypothetical protein
MKQDKTTVISRTIKENQEPLFPIGMITFLRMNDVENGAEDRFELV